MKLATMAGAVTMIIVAMAVLPAISLAQTVTVCGTVTDVNGMPVPGATVTLIDDYFNQMGATTTDGNGNFRFLNMTAYGSNLLKPLVTYVHDGHNYSTTANNVVWIDASAGIVNIPAEATRLYGYPESDHGYVWGTVMENLASGRALDATVYLDGPRLHESMGTGAGGVIGAFQIEVPPGEYTIYAVHDAGEYELVSNRTTITIGPSNSLLDAAPIVLIADRRVTGPLDDIEAVPLALAIVLGMMLVTMGWVLLNRQ